VASGRGRCNAIKFTPEGGRSEVGAKPAKRMR
jgi:hypothetical protein